MLVLLDKQLMVLMHKKMAATVPNKVFQLLYKIILLLDMLEYQYQYIHRLDTTSTTTTTTNSYD